jgi:hypothetical protein
MENQEQPTYWTNYYQKNRELCLVRNKKWRQDNIDKIRAGYKSYWERKGVDIKARRKEKIECDVCNCGVTRESLTRHKNSKKHLENISKLNSVPINIECPLKTQMED